MWDMAPYTAMHGICGSCLQCRKGLSLGLPRTHIVSEQGIMEAQRFLKGFPFYSTLRCSRHMPRGDPAQITNSEQKIFPRNRTSSRQVLSSVMRIADMQGYETACLASMPMHGTPVAKPENCLV